jgi:Lysozyme like domain
MPILSRQQIQQYAYNAGFRGAALNTIVAIAFAESGGNTTAYNPSDPYGGSFGLVQINGAHFSSGGTNQACADDPQCAMNYAFKLSNGGGNFLPWGTYTNGSWLHYLQGTGVTGVTGSSNFQGGSGSAGSGGSSTPAGFNPLSPGDWATAIQSAITNAFKPIVGDPNQKGSLISYISNPLRLVKTSTGIVLIIVALGLMVYGLGIVDVAVPEYGIINQTAKTLRKSAPGTPRRVRTGK